MKKYNIKDIVNRKYDEKVVVLCTTPKECKELVECYVARFNKSDILFEESKHYEYPGDMCIDLTSYGWTYASSNYHKEEECATIIPFSAVELGIKVRGFEVCSKRKNNIEEITLPRRGTSKAMAYDFFSPVSAVVQPGEIVKIWSDVKAYMKDDECLVLNVRSSMGGKFMLANTQGWIDADYYNNENNEGNIGFFLKNISNEPQVINVGDRIGQGAFFNFLVSDNGNPEEEIVRTGGFGSSGK